MSGRGPLERAAERGLYVAVGLAVFALVAVPVVVCGGGLRALLGFGEAQPGLLWRLDWSAGGPYGLLEPLGGSVLVTALATAWAAPVGIGAATWLAWFAPPRWRQPGRSAVAAAAAVPPVVIGFVGLGLVVPGLELLVGIGNGTGAVAASLMLGVLALPTVVVGADHAMRRVPRRRVEAALALGASRGQAVRAVVWPDARAGLQAAALLGVLRALGDTMVVALVAGTGAGAWLGPIRTLTVTLAEGLPVPADGAHHGALYVVAALLLAASLALGGLSVRLDPEVARVS